MMESQLAMPVDPFDPSLMRRYEVSSRVNLVKNGDSACAELVVREQWLACNTHGDFLVASSGSAHLCALSVMLSVLSREL